jgi:allantoate deiminase
MEKAANLAIARCRQLALFTEEPGHVTRTFLSPPMRGVHALLSEWLRAAGCEVTVDASVDAAGNLRGVYPGTDRDAAPLFIGSHLDTVLHAGSFDGILGVVLALSLVENLRGTRLKNPIVAIGFSEEEGVRYGVPFIGSRALTGTLSADLVNRISPAIREFGLDPAQLPNARVTRAAGFFEIHIEQGPVLESLNLPLGIVESIAGQTRAVVEFAGHANHAGTTPMHLRHDALAAAAEWISAVEREAAMTPGLVATVGKLEVEPGASNVIAGVARATLDVRHAVDAVRCSAVHNLRAAASHRGLPVTWTTRMDQPAVAMDPRMTANLERAAAAESVPTHRMVSGAGHDAMILAERCPSAMLFVRSPGGISHHPDETVLVEDVAAAIAVGARFLEQYG